MIDDDYVLGAAGGGGQYRPNIDAMVFAGPIADEFPYTDFPAIGEADIGPLAAVLEEFAHRAQYQSTHFGFVYRLACLIQSLKALEILAWLGESADRRLPLPWLAAEPTDPWLEEALADYRALDDMKRIFFGLSLPGGNVGVRVGNGLHRMKGLIHAYTPVEVRHFSTFGGIDELYDDNGTVNVAKTTRAIVESHASAFAFEVLRRHAPADLKDAVDDYIKANRRGLYKTVEEIAKSLDKPVTMDLGAVLRLGDFALDGKLIDIPTVPPPEDYVESALPFTRYSLAMQRFDSAAGALRRTGQRDLSLEKVVELVIFAHGDDRGIAEQMGLDAAMLQSGRRIQLQKEGDHIEAWLEAAERDTPLPNHGTFMRREIARASMTFKRGILSFEPDARKFDPTISGLVALCRLNDLPTIEYPDGIELFRCEEQAVEQPYLAWRVMVHGIASMTAMFPRADLAAVTACSNELARLGVPGLDDLADGYGFDVSQLA